MSKNQKIESDEKHHLRQGFSVLSSCFLTVILVYRGKGILSQLRKLRDEAATYNLGGNPLS